jgi:glycosyltransferase involved in cell wall biosynthesis
MKIIQVSSYYPPHLGGQENVVQDLAQQLAAAGHEAHVLTSTMGGGKRGVSNEKGVKVKRMWCAREFGHAPIMPCIIPTLLRIGRGDCVVHVHIGQAFTPEIVWLLSKFCNFRYVAELHIDFEPSGPAGVLLPFYKRFVLGRVLRSAAAVVVLNERTLKIVRKKYGVTGKALVMNNGIDESYFAVPRVKQSPVPPKKLRLLFVGRLSKQKNLSILLQAMAITKRDVHLDIVGEGDERASIVKMIRDLKLDNVKLHGRLHRQAVLEFYEKCDALVMPSLYEAQPLVLLEAMAARIPIIGTNVIGVAEHIWGTGIIATPSPEGLVQGFENFYESYGSLPKMIKNGRAKAEKLRWCNLRRDYETLYQEVLINEA